MIKTFVFLDLETTDLISRNRMPKITELSLLAVTRDAIYHNKDVLPRVLHKLTIPVNPQRQICKTSEKMTLLSNHNLSSVKPFESTTVGLLQYYLKNLLSPVCFVAHNGKRFDFPILLSEIESIRQDLCSDSTLDLCTILSMDSLEMFRAYFNGTPKKRQIKFVSAIGCTDPTDEGTSTKDLLNDGNDDLLLGAWDSFVSSNGDESNDSLDSIKVQNNCVDVMGKKMDDSFSTVSKMQKINEQTPEKNIIRSEICSSKVEIDFESDKAPNNFRLVTLHKHFMGCVPAVSHTAEDDCIALLRCVSKIGHFFTQWADQNAIPLNCNVK